MEPLLKASPSQIRALSELSLAIALSAVLSLLKLKLPHLLYGGSISLESVPLLVAALRFGPKAGATAGAAYGVVNFLMAPFFVHPIQVLLDYPLAFAMVGIAGWIAEARVDAGSSGRRRSDTFWVAAAIAAAETTRLGVHFVSGVVYFAHLAPEGTSVWQYSLAYNASYIVPEAIIDMAVVPVILGRLRSRSE